MPQDTTRNSYFELATFSNTEVAISWSRDNNAITCTTLRLSTPNLTLSDRTIHSRNASQRINNWRMGGRKFT